MFRDSFRTSVALAVLIPVILAMGSNAATQTMAVIVRGIHLSEVSWERGLGVLAKEALAGLASGAVVGALAAVAVGLWFKSVTLAGVVGAALVLNTMVACVVATFVPMLLKRFRVDPAVASSVFVITTTVIVGLLVYFVLGRILLQ